MAIRLSFVGLLATLIQVSAAFAATKYVAVKQIALQERFHTKSDWRVTAYQASGQDASFGDVPAKICFSRSASPDDCTFITSRDPDETLVFNHQTVKELKVVALTTKEVGVLLDAEFFGGGSGSLSQIAVWSYARPGDYFQRLLTLSLTEQGRYQLVASGPLEGDAISADYLWEKGEGHFGSHRYAIAVNRYIGDGPHGHILEYLTRQKYAGNDSTDEQIDVIKHELPRIGALLRNLYGR